ncbi:hypothetical protein BSQ39_08230 [Loigolactobacillus backii]|uniref:phage scaffolding protein n=1 Tax=Loigolactobacillus backii TaxID=375175 RepID=UPI000C1CAECF|nr:phage scaffolding protein [Loigolactobacillus backii]PIO83551.1 hypothetical protein BSQ39_08230 [Loigolactobacillus backii]
MERKELQDLKLDDDQVTAVMKLYNRDVEPLKSATDEATKASDDLKAQLGERDDQLKELSKATTDSKELQDQIAKLQDANKQATTDYQTKLAGAKKDSAIQLALRDNKARDAKAVLPFLDTEKIELDAKGSLKGLDDQLKQVKTDKAFLFESDEPAKPKEPPINIFGGGNPNGDGSDDGQSILAKVAARMQGDNK